MGDAIGRGFTVVVVVVPFSVGGLVALHQQSGFAAHVAIEVLHEELFPALGPSLEIAVAGEESVIR